MRTRTIINRVEKFTAVTYGKARLVEVGGVPARLGPGDRPQDHLGVGRGHPGPTGRPYVVRHSADELRSPIATLLVDPILN